MRNIIIGLLILSGGCAFHKTTIIKVNADKLSMPISGITTIKGEGVSVNLRRDISWNTAPAEKN